jgi:hypothetical protein
MDLKSIGFSRVVLNHGNAIFNHFSSNFPLFFTFISNPIASHKLSDKKINGLDFFERSNSFISS